MNKFTNNFYKYIEKSKKLHLNGNNIWTGGSLKKHISYIKDVIKKNNIKTILDYGCGKATCHKNKSTKVWNYDELFLYDPCVLEYNKKPIDKKFDLVICTDVLEHIPESDIDNILKELISYSNKLLFLSISTREADKKFFDNENVHLTIKNKDWWLDKLNKNKENNIKIIAFIEDSFDCYKEYKI